MYLPTAAFSGGSEESQLQEKTRKILFFISRCEKPNKQKVLTVQMEDFCVSTMTFSCPSDDKTDERIKPRFCADTKRAVSSWSVQLRLAESCPQCEQ